ncbi:uncharacterized protein LOC127843638 [Dreissena polymorpha]|uniref:Uncharacterized protein n=1 Tax=Dreissena polymorpha TaxID=45954 RepID=A0A9D4EAV7_DREPO|nr:uncharacterized protein LOC127843638 [Dreissena polymorpha]KAH3776982.1 hypothetical protein DPMN_178416 [Dreissena polymorpha]
MDFKYGSLFVLGLLAISAVCSDARGRVSSYRRSGSSVSSSGFEYIVGVVIGGFLIAIIAYVVICLLKKKGIICASPNVTSTPNSGINIVYKRDLTDNYSTGFVNPPPPPTYSAVYPPSYSNGNVSAPDPAPDYP